MKTKSGISITILSVSLLTLIFAYEFIGFSEFNVLWMLSNVTAIIFIIYILTILNISKKFIDTFKDLNIIGFSSAPYLLLSLPLICESLSKKEIFDEKCNMEAGN